MNVNILDATDGGVESAALLVAERNTSRTIPIDADALRSLRLRRMILTQGEFAERLKMSLSAYQNLEGGRTTTVYLRTLRRIAEVAEVSFDEAVQLVSPQSVPDRNVEPYSEQPVPVIPTFDLAVAAGHWVTIEENGEVCDPRQIDHGVFRIRIRGDSMTPRFKDGALVEFRCLRDGKHILEVGRFYYVQREGEATFKQLAAIDDEMLVLRALNKRKYPEKMPVERRSIVRMAVALFVLNEA